MKQTLLAIRVAFGVAVGLTALAGTGIAVMAVLAGTSGGGPVTALVVPIAAPVLLLGAVVIAWSAIGGGLRFLNALVISIEEGKNGEAPEPAVARGALADLLGTLTVGKERLNALILGLQDSVGESEAASRKLAIQVGDTLAATAQISSQTGDAQRRVEGLSEQVSTGAGAMEEILRAVESLVGRIERQDEIVAQSAAAIEEMTASIESVAGIAQSKRAAAEELRALTESGSAKVATTERVIGEVTQGVSGINSMIDVINDIAARTNLLAMNAAIEAAHAGEAGRGFAVVAGEIRQLAESTARNAGQISRTLKDLTATITEAHDASTQTGAAFRTIEAGAGTVADAFAEITASTAELNLGASEVVRATETLRQISTEIVGSAGEMRVGAEEVTSVLTATKEAARHTAASMQEIRDAAATVNVSSNRISELSMDSNDAVTGLLTRIESYRTGFAEEDREARQRLSISNIILKHMSWVSRSRSLIDGRLRIPREELVDHGQCALGQWLALEGKTVITDPGSYKRLADTHRELHERVERIVSCVQESSRECTDVEDEFRGLLETSRTIVEMLTGYQTGSFVRWTPAIAVNVETFDEHHRRLFALIDKLYKALQSGETREVLESVFDELLDYTGYHFGSEEAAFEHFGYPQCEHHRQRHRKLVEQAMALRRDLEAGKAMVAVEVMEFLRDWITNHIRGCDKLYSTFFKDKDVEQFFTRRDNQDRVEELEAAPIRSV